MRVLGAAACLLVVTVLGFSSTSGQVLRGRVIQAEGGRPIVGAQIEIVGRAGEQILSDSTGWFRIDLAGPGEFTVRVRMIGYATIEQKLQAAMREELMVEVRMAPTVISLEPIVVVGRTSTALGGVAGFYQRAALLKRLGGGTAFTRADIDQRNAGRLATLLISSVGVRVRGDTITFRRASTACRPQVLVDGLTYSTGVIDIPIDLVEGVEVYRGSSQIPTQYRDRASCGVVLIWTRRGEKGKTPLSWKYVAVGAAAIGAIILIFK